MPAGSDVVIVAGAGPAGSAAAIAARAAGAEVDLYEKSAFPRHKVCGEFLSPEVLPLLGQLGAREAFEAAAPHRYRRLVLHFPRAHKVAPLPETAFGFSRYAFDRLLLEHACARGARLHREPAPAANGAAPRVVATGRAFASRKGGRLFGFKAHWRGPLTDSIELFFFRGCYVGVNGVEGGATNVCGLGPEELLRRFNFQPDELLAGFAPLRDRLAPLARGMDWLLTGPLEFRNRLDASGEPRVYPAGDQISFIDPFTGSGVVSALISGMSAGRAAARGETPDAHRARCRAALGMPFGFASLMRRAIEWGAADWLVPWIPARALVCWTRPRI